MNKDMLDPIGHSGNLVGFGLSALYVLRDKGGKSMTATECYRAAIELYPPKNDDERTDFRRVADFVLLIEDLLEELNLVTTDRFLVALSIGALKGNPKENKSKVRKAMRELLSNVLMVDKH